MQDVVFEFTITSASEGERRVAFPSARFSIGTAPSAGIRLSSTALRPQHVEIDASGPFPRMRALSNSGFRLDGLKVMEGELRDESIVQLGDVQLRLVRGSAPPKKSMRTPVKGRKQPLPSLNDDEEGDTAFARTTQHQELRADQSLTAGAIVAERYRITARLAAGGMGEVYKAEHIELKKPVAIKVMLPALSMDPEFVARFKLEATSASRIGQQNIIDVIDFGRLSDGRFFFVMEFIEGQTLTEVIRVEPPIALKRTISIATQVSRALAAAHSAGIVHRDLKPENIMVSQRPGHPDFVKVLDFGVAKIPESMGASGSTQIGTVVGTPQYMSPEQAKTIPVTAASDIYSLGLIFYEMLTGTAAFDGETASILMMKQVYEAPPPFTPALSGATPESLRTVIFRMLEKEPGQRPASMEDVIEVLETAQFDQQITQRMMKQQTPVPRTVVEAPLEIPKSKAPLFVALGIGVALLSAVGWFVTRNEAEPERVPLPVVEVTPVETAPVVAEPPQPAPVAVVPIAPVEAVAPVPPPIAEPKKKPGPAKKKARETDLKDPFGD